MVSIFSGLIQGTSPVALRMQNYKKSIWKTMRKPFSIKLWKIYPKAKTGEEVATCEDV